MFLHDYPLGEGNLDRQVDLAVVQDVGLKLDRFLALFQVGDQFMLIDHQPGQ
ncbi:hypothetical protein D3C75_1253770 [compost metagenome]